MTCMPTRFSGGQPATPCMHTAYSAIKTMLPQTHIPQTRTPPHISSPLSNKNISMVMGQVFLTHIHGPSQTWLAGVIMWNEILNISLYAHIKWKPTCNLLLSHFIQTMLNFATQTFTSTWAWMQSGCCHSQSETSGKVNSYTQWSSSKEVRSLLSFSFLEITSVFK